MFSIPKPHRLTAGVLALAALAQAANYSAWSHYRDVTVNTSTLGLSAPVKKLPVLVRFDAATHGDMLNGANQIQAGGADIRVTKADGTTDVPFEIETATTGANGSLVLWILADSVAQNSAEAAKFRVFWGKAGASSKSNGAAVFDTTGGAFTGVWHMNGTDGEVDATDNQYDAAATGAPGSVAGVIGSARKFNEDRGFGQYLTVTNSASSKLNYGVNGPYTVSAWVNADSITTATPQYGTGHAIFNKGNDQWALAVYGTASHKFYEITTKGNNTWQQVQSVTSEDSITANPGAGNWQYVTGTWEPTETGSIGRIYVNGKLWNARTITNGENPNQGRTLTRNVFIGNLGGTERGWWGLIDEVRASAVVRDSNFIALEYATQRPTGSVVAIGTSQAQVPPVGLYPEWGKTRDIKLNTTVQGANVSENVYNFPVLIRLGAAEASILSEAKANGEDIRFSRGSVALPYEIEHWSANSAAIWVKVDTILGNSDDQSITLHWDNTDAVSASNGAAVFDTLNGYIAVMHMNGTTTETSSTGHAFTATPFGAPGVIADAAIGGGREFDGTQHMQILNSANSALNLASDTTYTFSAWVRSDSIVPTGDNTGHAVITKGDHQWGFAVFGATAPNRHYEIATKVGGMWNWQQTTTAPAGHYAGSYANDNIGKWRHMVGTWNGKTLTSAVGRIYLDGELQKETIFNITGAATSGRQTARDVHIGVLSNQASNNTDPTGALQRFWVGGLDEITVSGTVRSPAWVKLSYMNQKAVNALVDIGAFEYGNKAPAAPTAVTGVAGNGEATVSWTAPANNGGAAISGYTVKSVPDNKTCTTTGATSCTVTGLTNGTSYTFSVTATNSVGTSVVSAPSAAVKPSAIIGWTKSRTITLNTTASGANVAGDVRNFPVLIRLTSDEATILSEAKANGADIRFLKGDSATIIPHEIESWSATGAAIWVKLDTIKGNNNTQKIHMLWGNDNANSTSNGAAVFDSANGFVAVYHMNGAAAETNVAGDAALNAAATGTVPAVAGLIGSARSFGGTTETYLSVPNSASGKLNFSSETNYTLSAWVYSEEATIDNRGIFNKGNDQWLIGVYGGGEEKYYDLMTRGNNSWNQAATSNEANPITTANGVGVWRHVVGVWKGAGTPQDTARIYINGVLANTTFFDDIGNESQGRNMSTDVYIGALWENGGLTRPYHGRIDEVIASNVFRDSNWVKLSYENQKIGNSLVNIGTALPPAQAPSAPTNVSAAGGAAVGSITVTWTTPANAGTSPITSYTATAAPGGATCTATAPATTCTVTGLTAGSYTFTVTATSAAGTSAASAASNAASPTALLPGSFVIHMDGHKPYSYSIPASLVASTERLTMTIVNVQGKRVWSKTITPAKSKVSELTWDGRNTNGMRASAGMYIVRIEAAMASGETIKAEQKGVNLKP